MNRDTMHALWKKAGLTLFILAMFALAACGKQKEPAPAPQTEPAVTAAPTAAPTAEPVVTATPEIPEETETPAEPADEPGKPVSLTEAQQYAANLSMSNFSEQNFCGGGPFDSYDAAEASVAQLFRFAHLWAKINRPSALSYEGNYETLTRENFFDIITPRIAFPAGLEPIEGEDYSAVLGIGRFDWDHCWYENGRFYYPAGDGESYNAFTVVDEAYLLDNGDYRFRFTVYELDLDIYWDELGVSDKYYHLTPAEAAQIAATGELTPMRTGTALCTPVYWEQSGRDMFRLLSYELDPLD